MKTEATYYIGTALVVKSIDGKKTENGGYDKIVITFFCVRGE
jgi:hypothetical protein